MVKSPGEFLGLPGKKNAPEETEALIEAMLPDSVKIIRYLAELEEKHEKEAKLAERRQKRHNWLLGIICALLGALFASAITFLSLRFFGIAL